MGPNFLMQGGSRGMLGSIKFCLAEQLNWIEGFLRFQTSVNVETVCPLSSACSSRQFRNVLSLNSGDGTGDYPHQAELQLRTALCWEAAFSQQIWLQELGSDSFRQGCY